MPKIINNLREKLMVKGREILIFKGYNSLNIRDLVKECDIAIGTFYNYYKNKDEIVNAIIKADWEKIIASTAAKMKNQDLNFKEKMYIMYDGVNEFFKNYLDTFMVMISNGAREHRYRNDKILVPYENILKEILVFHKNKGDISYTIEDEKLSKLILNNIIFICKDNSISFDDFYLSLNFLPFYHHYHYYNVIKDQYYIYHNTIYNHSLK